MPSVHKRLPLVPLGRVVKVPDLDPDRGPAVGARGSGTAVVLAPMLVGLLARVVPLRDGFLAAIPVLLGLLALHQLARVETEGSPFVGLPTEEALHVPVKGSDVDRGATGRRPRRGPSVSAVHPVKRRMLVPVLGRGGY